MAGYSGTPLARKLGLKAGSRLKVKNAPRHYERLLRPLPRDVVISPRLRGPVDIWHLFTRSETGLSGLIRNALREVAPGGAIWVSWPKKASGVRSSVTEDVVRREALPLGLVDVKVCAVDDTWSGLKLVRRRSAQP